MTDNAMPYFPAEVEMAERAKIEAKQATDRKVETYLARSGGRLACPHPVHRFAQVPNSPATLILPECAGREQWLRARLDGIGGSEVGALVGVNDYETAWSIWNKKTLDKKTEELTGAPIEWGHRFEDAVAQKTADEIGLVSRFAGGLWADREKPHIRVTPDRFATKPRTWKAIGVIESKTAGDGDEWESGTIRPGGLGSGSAPLAYQCQIQWQMGILGLPIGWLGCHVSNRARDFYVVEVHFDKEWFAEMVHAADHFWTNSVLAYEPPMHDLRHPKTEELLKLINPAVIKPSVDLPSEAEEWLTEYLAAKDAAEKADARLAEIKNFFRLMTGDAGAGYLGEEKIVSYPSVATSKVDVGLLKEKYPEIAEAVTVKNSHRRLTITVPKRLKSKKVRP